MNRPRPTGPVFYPYVVRPNPSEGYDVWFKAWQQLPHIIATFDTNEQARELAIVLNESYRKQQDIALELSRKIEELGQPNLSQTRELTLLERVRAWLCL